MLHIANRLAQLGITLPDLTAPVANYVPFVRSGRIVQISGQLARSGETIVKGRVGVDLTLEQGQAAARICAINLLAQFRAACGGDLDRVVRVMRLGGYVQVGPEFDAIPQVVNGASDLMVDVFGDKGRHARSAIGVYRLPLGVAVEVDAMIEVA
ncbi:RidA family protein [Novosphingobium sp.]|uniref:RidA family protein n=1 Tax=Novosphingobium sp. TaxID=1874826 RepID=UPI0031E12D6B